MRETYCAVRDIEPDEDIIGIYINVDTEEPVYRRLLINVDNGAKGFVCSPAELRHMGEQLLAFADKFDRDAETEIHRAMMTGFKRGVEYCGQPYDETAKRFAKEVTLLD